MEKLVKLQPSDDATKVFEVKPEVAEMSTTIKNMLEDLGADNDGLVIPLNNITTKMLEKVIEFCEHTLAKGPQVQTEGEAKPSDLDEWDIQFCTMDQEELFALILASNYLDIKLLLDLTCKTVANMIKGKSPEEIRKTFNIKNDFTPEEEEKIRKENEWCEDM